MKTIYLLRHAKASNEDLSLPDIKRPLTDRGFADARLVSETLNRQKLIPEKIISSNAVRAISSAAVFAAAFDKQDIDIDIYESLYDSFENDYIEVIAGLSDTFSSCMLAGHNDTISYVASKLLQKIIDPMKTCEVLVISSDAHTWKEFASSPCTLEFRLSPSDLKEN